MLRSSTGLTATNKTVFGKNINLTISNNDSSNQLLVAMYAKLAVVVHTINTLMTEFSKGHFYTVANILTQTIYNKLSINLANLAVSANKFPDFETIRISSTSALGGLYKSILQYSDYVNMEEQLALAKEHEAILYDRVKLQDFINKMNQNRQVFPESKVTVTKATLKPEYAAYVKQFGFPEGAVFEPDKLAYVLQQLGIK